MLARIASYFRAKVVERRSSAKNPALEVALRNGRRVLDSARVNYSFGGLHAAFADVFQELEVKRRAPQTALVLGLGAGSIPELLSAYQRPPQTVGVEWDPEVVDLGRRYFGLDDHAFLEVVVGEAAAFMRENERRFDLICVDLFQDALVPPAAETPAFLRALEAALTENGLLIFNRINIDADTCRSTAQFGEKFLAVFPNMFVYKTLVNEFFIEDRAPARPL